jgi:hypothetical protein
VHYSIQKIGGGVLPSLLFSTGFLMVIGALPAGLMILLEDHYQFHSDWHGATIAAAYRAIPVATTGGLFLCGATLIFKCRAKKTSEISK